MRSYEQMLKEFHSKHGFAINEPLERQTLGASSELNRIGIMLIELSKAWENGTLHPDMDRPGDYDLRLIRAHLIVEEVGELLVAMSQCNEVQTLDGLCDAVYVLVGTAVAFGLPFDAGFLEVQRSNMTKEADGSERLRHKGNTYEPPDLLRIIEEHRRNVQE